jgi:hypothetical protein
MRPCTRHPVSDEAFAFAHEQLWLAPGLEPYLRLILTPARFTASAVAGVDTAPERLAQFAVGGALCSQQGLRDFLGRLVRVTLDGEPGAAWIVPDPMADATLHRNDEVPIGAWRAAESAAGQMGLVTTGGGAPEALASHATLVVMTAYDGDGLRVFERRRRQRGLAVELGELEFPVYELDAWDGPRSSGGVVPGRSVSLDFGDPSGDRWWRVTSEPRHGITPADRAAGLLEATISMVAKLRELLGAPPTSSARGDATRMLLRVDGEPVEFSAVRSGSLFAAATEAIEISGSGEPAELALRTLTDPAPYRRRADPVEQLWEPYREELRRDFISLSELVRRVARMHPDLGDADVRRATFDVLRYVLEREEAEAGQFDGGTFAPWDQPPGVVVRRAAEAWDALGRTPNVGEILWLQDAGARDALLQRLTRRLAGVFRNRDPAAAATRANVEDAVRRIGRLLGKGAVFPRHEPFSDDEADALVASVLSRLSADRT